MVTAGLKKILPSDLTRIDVAGHPKNTIFVPAFTNKTAWKTLAGHAATDIFASTCTNRIDLALDSQF